MKLEDPRAVEPLIAMLGDESEVVRHSAAQALGELADPRAVAPLNTLLTDTQYVRDVAANALKRLALA